MIAKNWNKSNISKVLSLKTDNLQKCDIKATMKEIENCSKFLKQQDSFELGIM